MSPEQLAAFAQWIKDKRKQSDLSRLAFCKLVRVSRTTLRGLESGRQQPTQATINKIAKALKVSPDLLTGSNRFELDPRWKDLDPEDLVIAQAYHHAIADLKYAIQNLFDFKVTADMRKRFARLFLQLLQSPEGFEDIETFALARRQVDAPEDSSAPTKREKKL